MATLIERGVKSRRDVSSFYDGLATDYDLMTGFEKRFVRERPFFRHLVGRDGIGTALDAGCGTGFHSLLLAQLGVKVTAVDISKKMLARLSTHAHAMHLPVSVVHSSFQDLDANVHGTFDALFSLGNSLAHLLSREELSCVLKNFARVLRPGGKLYLQNLNYDRVLQTRDRVQNVTEQDGVTFVRFYDYLPDRIRFNVLVLRRGADGIDSELHGVDIRPLTRSELVKELAQAKFSAVAAYGGISMEEFHPESSKDLLIQATNSR